MSKYSEFLKQRKTNGLDFFSRRGQLQNNEQSISNQKPRVRQ